MGRGRAWRILPVFLALVLAAGTAAVAADRAGLVDLAPGPARTAGTAGTGAAPVPTPAPDVVRPPVLPGADPAALVPGGVARVLEPLLADPAFGGRVVAHVVDVLTGRTVFDRGGGTSVLPASTAKLVTAAAALRALSPETRFTTTVLTGATAGEVVLVGGGDPLLAGPTAHPGYPAPARLADLAGAVAGAIQAKGGTVTRIVVDGSLFSGPPLAPGWKPTYLTEGSVAPVSALMVDGGRIRPGKDPRYADPDLAAGRALAGLLASQGVASATVPVVRGSAPPGAERLAEVTSATVASIVEHALSTSDNDAAEALARHVALRTGRPGTFAGAAAAVAAEVAGLGLPPASLALVDGSGLSRDDRVQPYAVARLLALASGGARPELRPLVTGLPVAGFDGTLEDRYLRGTATAAAGRVRAKTGTLLGVSALAGLLVDRDGRLLALDLTADQVPIGRTRAAEDALDRVAAALAGCGCG